MIDTSSYSTNTSSTTSTLKLGFCRARNSDITIYFPLVTLPRAGYIKFIKDLFLISPMRVSVRPLSPTCCSSASSAFSSWPSSSAFSSWPSSSASPSSPPFAWPPQPPSPRPRRRQECHRRCCYCYCCCNCVESSSCSCASSCASSTVGSIFGLNCTSMRLNVDIFS